MTTNHKYTICCEELHQSKHTVHISIWWCEITMEIERLIMVSQAELVASVSNTIKWLFFLFILFCYAIVTNCVVPGKILCSGCAIHVVPKLQWYANSVFFYYFGFAFVDFLEHIISFHSYVYAFIDNNLDGIQRGLHIAVQIHTNKYRYTLIHIHIHRCCIQYMLCK